MTGSRGSAARFAFALALGLGCAGFAYAEETTGPAVAPPKGLTPPPVDSSQIPPPPDQNAAPATPATPKSETGTYEWNKPVEQTIPAQSGQPAGPAVTVQGLGAIDTSGAGLVDEKSGGFRPTLWNGTSRGIVEERLARMPDASTSPTMQTLTHRLLLASGTPPQGGEGNQQSLLALRLRKLIANGWLPEAAVLGASAARTDALAHEAQAEALFLQGKQVEACGEPTALRQTSNTAYWLKVRVVCYLVVGDTTSAQLTLDVMREREISDDTFFALASKVIDNTKADVAFNAPTGVHVALAQMSKTALPVSLLDAGWTPGLPILAAPSSPPAVRLAAAERAAAAGLIQIDQLRALYDTETFTFDQVDDPEEASKKLTQAQTNALYYQAIEKRTVPAARASAFAAALQRADAQNVFPLFALTAADAAMEIQPAPATAWLAPYIVRVLLYTGNDVQAEKWYSALSAASASDAPVINAIQMQTMLASPTIERVNKSQGAITWLAQNAMKDGGAKAWLMERATREIPLFQALNFVIPPEAQWAVTANTAGALPTPEQTQALDDMTRAAAQGRLGETVMNALIALGPGGPTRAEGHTVARVVKALVAVGLAEEARAVAIEAVLGAPVNVRK